MRISVFSLGFLIPTTAAAALTSDDAKSCNANVGPIDFLLLEGDANAEAVEDEIRTYLEKLGFTVKSRFLPKMEYNEALSKGEYGLCFSEGWGSPYDPHSYASAWEAEDNPMNNALVALEAPSSRDELLGLIEDVLQEEDHFTRQTKWTKVHEYYHAQAVMVPLYGRRIAAIINSRLTGYQAGHQQFDFPVHKLIPIAGSKTATISPGAQTGRFKTVGNMNPHTYNPNEFFANNWVYEGLVSYGEEGQILPSLASSWTEEETSEGGMKYTFLLRQNVTFHDGAIWDCAAAKLNLDHVLAEVLRTPDWHGWYGVPKYIKDWECTDENTLVLTTSTKFYPFMQELTFIRPLRFLSPNAFASTSDPYTANSCEPGWGTIDGTAAGVPNVTCVGIANISGTGPFSFASREQSVLTTEDLEEELIDDIVTFQANSKYWGGAPAIETLKVVRYESTEEIKQALVDQTVDVMWGDGVLASNDITDIDRMNDPNLNVFIGEEIQNVILILNTGTPPLDDIRIRKAIIHAIDKKYLVKKELGGFTEPAENVFPRDMPYCDVDLTPHWDYDLEKAILVSCEGDSASLSGSAAESSSSGKNSLALGLGLGLGAVAIIAVGIAYIEVNRNKALLAKYVASEAAISA